MTLEKGLAAFLDAMLGRNRSTATLRAYRTDVLQFITFLHENNVAITDVGDVGKVDVLEYLASLARKGLSGVARARKVSAIREYFRFLEGVGPALSISLPLRNESGRCHMTTVFIGCSGGRFLFGTARMLAVFRKLDRRRELAQSLGQRGRRHRPEHLPVGCWDRHHHAVVSLADLQRQRIA
jgi:hypothetical protein